MAWDDEDDYNDEEDVFPSPWYEQADKPASSVTWLDCSGDACKGDTIRFTEAVWDKDEHDNNVPIGERTITAKILKDSYGVKSQQHTFSLEVIECEGDNLLSVGLKTHRKGRNIYRNGTKRLRWTDENKRKVALEEKHQRGDEARAERAKRKGIMPRYTNFR